MLFSFLRRLFRPRPTPFQVCFYTRQGCHLCDEAWKLVQTFQSQYKFSTEKIDIDTDPNLVEKHGSWVPVVEVNGKVRFRGKVNPVLFRRLLEGEK